LRAVLPLQSEQKVFFVVDAVANRQESFERFIGTPVSAALVLGHEAPRAVAFIGTLQRYCAKAWKWPPRIDEKAERLKMPVEIGVACQSWPNTGVPGRP
jgi:hypothetical protein